MILATILAPKLVAQKAIAPTLGTHFLQDVSNMAPGAPQERPKGVPRVTQRVQDRSKIAPRAPQEPSKNAQERPKSDQEHPKGTKTRKNAQKHS